MKLSDKFPGIFLQLLQQSAINMENDMKEMRPKKEAKKPKKMTRDDSKQDIMLIKKEVKKSALKK